MVQRVFEQGSLTRLFELGFFEIPDYQRGYSWETEHRQALLEDIHDLLPGARHFTGTIVVHRTGEPLLDYLAQKGDDLRPPGSVTLGDVEEERFAPLGIVFVYLVVRGRDRNLRRGGMDIRGLFNVNPISMAGRGSHSPSSWSWQACSWSGGCGPGRGCALTGTIPTMRGTCSGPGWRGGRTKARRSAVRFGPPTSRAHRRHPRASVARCRATRSASSRPAPARGHDPRQDPSRGRRASSAPRSADR